MPSSADIVRSWAANLAPAAAPVKAAGKPFSDAADRPKLGAGNNQAREGGKMAPILSKEAARDFYDRLGARQDTQAFYEDPATAVLIAHAASPNGFSRLICRRDAATGGSISAPPWSAWPAPASAAGAVAPRWS